MNMLQENTNSTQHRILDQLMANKHGLSIAALADALNVTRTAVQQHFIALERDGLIKKKQANKTAGRPVTIYELTDLGINYFPKQYAWFSEIVLDDLLKELGEEKFIEFMQRLGRNTAGQLKQKFTSPHLENNVNELVNLMSTLGYQAHCIKTKDSNTLTIEATNCIYHDLAQNHQAICAFDIALMSSLLDKEVQHPQCMAKGGCSCKFLI